MVAVKRGVLLFGCAVAMAAGPLVVASPASATCPYGTAQTKWEGVCTKTGSSGPIYTPPAVTPGGADVVSNPNELTRVNGIPCTPDKIGTCIALQQSQG